MPGHDDDARMQRHCLEETCQKHRAVNAIGGSVGETLPRQADSLQGNGVGGEEGDRRVDVLDVDLGLYGFVRCLHLGDHAIPVAW